MTIKKGNKTATIRKAQDGYGDTIYRTKVVINFNNGIENDSILVHGSIKEYSRESSAKRFVNKLLK